MTNLIDKLKAAVSPDLTNMLTSHNQNSEAHADIREAIANAGGAIKDEDLYLKAQFITFRDSYTITTTKKSFLLDETHNNIVETIYLNEPITYEYEGSDTIRDIYNEDKIEVAYRDDPEFSSFSTEVAEDIDVIFVSMEQE